MKKITLIIFSVYMMLAVFCGCGNNTPDGTPSLVNFFAYEGVDGISDIQEVTLPKEFSSRCKSYKFTYSSDGCAVKGYISIPLSCSDTNPLQCVLYNRGGNSNMGLLTNLDTARICSATDRVVIASQYRGADGGSGKDEFGGSDLNDVIKLIDLCENTFSFTQMEDFCVAGISRGGMMTYMTARHDNRVKRIIAVSAVSDLFSSWDERVDMQKLLRESIGGSPDLLPKEYENRSAVRWADEITVPTLIIHSKGDELVSFSQAEAMNAKLSSNGTNCTFITYDDDTHGFHEEDMNVINRWLSN